MIQPTPILLLARGGQMDGAQRQLSYLVCGMDRTLYRPVVVLDRAGPLAEELQAYGQVHVMKMRSWRSLGGACLGSLDARRLEQVANQCGARLIHASDPRRAGYAFHVANRLGIPSIIHVRGPITPRGIRKYRLERASALVPIATRYQAALEAGGLDPNRIHYIDDAVDLCRFTPDHPDRLAIRRQWGAGDRPVVALVGRIEPFKRTIQFLHLLARASSGPAAQAAYWIVGEPGRAGYMRQVRAAVQRLGLSDRVRFTGRCDNMPAALSAIDLLVTLSGGSVMFEAMACAKPVLSIRDDRRHSAHLLHGRTGWCIDDGNMESAAQALQTLLADPLLRQQLGRAAHQRAREHLSTDRLVQRTQALYAKLLDGQKEDIENILSVAGSTARNSW